VNEEDCGELIFKCDAMLSFFKAILEDQLIEIHSPLKESRLGIAHDSIKSRLILQNAFICEAMDFLTRHLLVDENG
jgi:hypothetical protein